MGPGSEVTFFLAATSDSTLSIPNQSKKFSISVIALFDNMLNFIKKCKKLWVINYFIYLVVPASKSMSTRVDDVIEGFLGLLCLASLGLGRIKFTGALFDLTYYVINK